MATISQVPAGHSARYSVQETRPCSQCKQLVPITEIFKMCTSCREKNRRYSAQSKQRKRQALVDLKFQGADHIAESEKPKRKADGDGDVTKKRVKTAHIKETNNVRRAKIMEEAYDYGTEYQTAAEMYEALTTSSKSKKYNFRGHFSIVAGDTRDNRLRVNVVAKDLRRVTNIQFVGKSIATSSSKTDYSATFQCSCLSPVRKPIAKHRHNQDVYATGPLELTSTEISDPNPQNDTHPLCMGKLNVIVKNDESHPFMAGQKIIITVEH